MNNLKDNIKTSGANDIPCLDDIVFEFRNKEYGAYQLRKKYAKRGCVSLLVAILIVCLSLLIPYYRLTRPGNLYIGYGYGSGNGKGVYVSSEHFEPLPEPEEQIYISVASAPPRPQPKAIVEEMKYAVPEIVDTLPYAYSELASMDEILDNVMDSTLIDFDDDFVFYSDGFDFGLGGGDGFGSGSSFLIVEKLPSFQGGDINKFRQWVVQHTNYPEQAIKEKIQGRVVLTFIIETDGSVSNVNVAKSLHPIVDDTVVEVLQSSPRWSPGKQDGKPVRVRYSLGLNFVL